MKKTCFVSIAIVLCIAFWTGCRTSEPEIAPNETVKILTSITRAGRTDFDNNDEITLYYGDRLTDDSTRFKYTSGEWTTTTPLYWENLTSVNGQYPFIGIYPTGMSAPGSFSVQTDQNTSTEGEKSNYEKSDLLIARTSLASANVEVNLTFRHVLAQMNVVLDCILENNVPLYSEEILKQAVVTIAGLQTAILADFSTPVSQNNNLTPVQASGPAQNVTLRQMNTNATHIAIVPPQSPEANQIEIKISIPLDDHTNKTYVYKNSGKVDFQQNKKTVISLTLSKNEVHLNSAISIDDWDDVPIEVNGNAFSQS